MIVTEGLTKTYGRVRALENLSMEIRKGEVFGLLGPNGSGKTTTIRLILGLIRATKGKARVSTFDCWKNSLEVRQLVSYLPGELRLPGGMSGYNLLRYLSNLRGGECLDRAVAIGEQVMGLDLRRKVRTYSTGMKQKLALAQAFADPVDVLILDEPTSALDPSARGLVLGLVAEAKASGQTVIFSGHVLSEVEQVSDRVAIMRRGRLMHVEDLHTRRQDRRLVLARFAERIPAGAPDELGLELMDRKSDAVGLFSHRGPLAPLLRWMADEGVVDVAVGTEDLRSLYDQYHGPNALPDPPDA